MAHTLDLNPTTVTLQPGGPAQLVVATVSNVPADATVTDVVEAVLGGVTATANVSITVDHPAPLVQVPSPSAGVSYQIATPIQDADDPSVWTCEISVSA